MYTNKNPINNQMYIMKYVIEKKFFFRAFAHFNKNNNDANCELMRPRAHNNNQTI
jgi:hypothetical protein